MLEWHQLKEQYDSQHQQLAALEEERAAVANKYAKLELEFFQRERDREKEFKADLQKVVADFTAKAHELVAQIEDEATQRKVRKEVERRTSELKASATMTGRKLLFETKAGTSEPVIATVEPENFEINVGDRVKVLSLGQDGVVETLNDDIVSVQVGALRFRETRENLRLIERKQVSKAAQAGIAGLPKGVSVSLNEDRPDVQIGRAHV